VKSTLSSNPKQDAFKTDKWQGNSPDTQLNKNMQPYAANLY